MILSDCSPTQIQLDAKESNTFTESFPFTSSDAEDCLIQTSDSQFYPCIVPVYNGQVLNIQPQLIHATLSGISIKHYNGKCFNEEEEIESLYFPDEKYGFELFEKCPSISDKPGSKSTSKTEGFLQREDSSTEAKFSRPLCMLPKINFRNSFWNIHRPELCKLTWAQKYVSTATVTEHLHEHLLSHGFLCAAFHGEEDRKNILNTELNEFGRLKDIPPDEKFILFKIGEKRHFNPKCKAVLGADKQIYSNRERFLSLNDEDEPLPDKIIHRSKEEFCITIGKHIRKEPSMSVSLIEEGFSIPVLPYGSPEEDDIYFSYYWPQLQAEQSYEYQSEDSTGSRTDFEIEPTPITDPCPPLLMDDFCRAAAKADFSDLRCNPDDF